MLHWWEFRNLAAVGEDSRDEALALGDPFNLHGDAFNAALDPLEAIRHIRRQGSRRRAAAFDPARPCPRERKEHIGHGSEYDRYDQDVFVHALSSAVPLPAGKISRISVPDPRVLSASTRPPCATTVCFTIASPSPVPPVLSVTYGSKIDVSLSGAIPTPVSRTATTISRPPATARADTRTAISPRAPLASTALSSTLSTARASAS